MVFVTFEKIQDARTGNILFQYLASKVISFELGHTYIPIEEIGEIGENIIRVDDANYADVLKGNIPNIQEKNIICRGFFQKGEYYIPIRDSLLQHFSNCDDYWIGVKGRKQYIRDFLQASTHSIKDLSETLESKNETKEFSVQTSTSSSTPPLLQKDVVISLRLDDFIQLPCPTSDIVPPEYYLEVLEKIKGINRLFIVCDTIRQDWEHQYIKFFDKWNPIILQKDLMHDCALIRDAPILLHSNSTLCWFMSFLSTNKTKTRYIPKTNFYSSQSLNEIDDSDTLQIVYPLYHNEVHHLNPNNYNKKNIYPLSYSIPDECIVEFEEAARNKIREFADLGPGETGDKSNYRYGPDDEAAYHKMYQNSLFALTKKKGGWDCLRHYEILANGCIPIFETLSSHSSSPEFKRNVTPNGSQRLASGGPRLCTFLQSLENCPHLTMFSLPKELLIEAKEQLLPWNFDKKPLYDTYLKRLLEYFKKNCSTSATVQNFFDFLPKEVKLKTRNVLLVMGNCGVNYTRETFWIGMKRYIQSLGGVAVEYPKIDFLYKDYSGEKKNLYGNGYTYANRLTPDYDFSKEEIEEKVANHFFDLIIYGKVGPDEGWEGSLPNMPLWNQVFKNYSKNEIVFLYGGDECIDLTYNNHYQEHIMYHSQYAHCFVRELNMI